MTYAAETTVTVERSKMELEQILARYGADAFMYGWNEHGAVVQFRAHDRHVRFDLPLPRRDDPAFTEYQRGINTHKRDADAALKRWEQASRQRWRALCLVVKAKLEAVESGIAEFEQEFLAYIVLPDGTTAGQWMQPQIADAYEHGQMPEMRLALPPGAQKP